MKNFYEETTACIAMYNQVANKVMEGATDTTNDEDEFMYNFCIYLAQALIKDTGLSDRAREELTKVADIINDVCR